MCVCASVSQVCYCLDGLLGSKSISGCCLRTRPEWWQICPATKLSVRCPYGPGGELSLICATNILSTLSWFAKRQDLSGLTLLNFASWCSCSSFLTGCELQASPPAHLMMVWTLWLITRVTQEALNHVTKSVNVPQTSSLSHKCFICSPQAPRRGVPVMTATCAGPPCSLWCRLVSSTAASCSVRWWPVRRWPCAVNRCGTRSWSST